MAPGWDPFGAVGGLLGCWDWRWDFEVAISGGPVDGPEMCSAAALPPSVGASLSSLHMRVGSFWTSTKSFCLTPSREIGARCGNDGQHVNLGLRENVFAMFDLLRVVQPSCWGVSPHSACREATPVLYEHFGTVLSCRFQG